MDGWRDDKDTDAESVFYYNEAFKYQTEERVIFKNIYANIVDSILVVMYVYLGGGFLNMISETSNAVIINKEEKGLLLMINHREEGLYV